MRLGRNWFYRPRLDYELKQYEAMAFEQYLDKCLKENILVPPMHELEMQLHTVGGFLHEINQQVYSEDKKISSIDLEKAVINYAHYKDNCLQEIEQICNFLLKKIKPYHERFEDLRKKVMDEITLSPVGVCPVYCDEGWLLLQHRKKIDVFYYRHRKVLLEDSQQFFHTDFYRSFDFSFADSLHEIKRQLVKEHREFPNPATYFASSASTWPVQETFLPLALQKLAITTELKQ